MPYLLETYKGEKARRKASGSDFPPHAPIVPADMLDKVETVEVMASSFNDPGADYCKLIARDASGTELGTVTVPGY